MASSALALAYETVGRAEHALEQLSLVHSISTQTGDIRLKSQASKKLGQLYAKVGDMPQSVKSLSQHFELLKVISAKRNEASEEASASEGVSVAQTDLARAFVGISKGNLMFNSYTAALKADAARLIDWKLNRTALGDEQQLIQPTETPAGSNSYEEAEEAQPEIVVDSVPSSGSVDGDAKEVVVEVDGEATTAQGEGDGVPEPEQEVRVDQEGSAAPESRPADADAEPISVDVE